MAQSAPSSVRSLGRETRGYSWACAVVVGWLVMVGSPVILALAGRGRDPLAHDDGAALILCWLHASSSDNKSIVYGADSPLPSRFSEPMTRIARAREILLCHKVRCEEAGADEQNGNLRSLQRQLNLFFPPVARFELRIHPQRDVALAHIGFKCLENPFRYGSLFS